MENYDEKNTNSTGTFTVSDVVLMSALGTRTCVTRWKLTHNDVLSSVSARKIDCKNFVSYFSERIGQVHNKPKHKKNQMFHNLSTYIKKTISDKPSTILDDSK